MSVRQTIAKLVSAGQIVECSAQWTTEISRKKIAAKFKDRKLHKIVTGHFVTGREYVKKDADGNPDASSDPKSLPWGEWESYPYVIRYGDKDYLRFSDAEGNFATVCYFIDDEEVSKEEFKSMLIPSEAKKMGQEKGCFNVTIDSIHRLTESATLEA